jgi:hypothetical protein
VEHVLSIRDLIPTDADAAIAKINEVLVDALGVSPTRSS